MSLMIPGLDGLRAIAFLLVFALHTNYLQIGSVRVSLFFVLSGFLIIGILLDMKRALGSKPYFLKFYDRRLLRIFPLYYFSLFLVIVITTWLISALYRPRYMQIALVATIVLVTLSFYLTERPIHNLQDRFFSVRKPRSEEKTLTITADS